MSLFGMKDKSKQKASQAGRSTRVPLGSQQTLFDLLSRNLLGQQAALPDTPISVPLQQSISGGQDVMQGLLNQAFGLQNQASLAGRLAGQGAVSGIQPAAGAPAFGRQQTREELGLPARREYFPFTPTPEEIEQGPGLEPIRSRPVAKRASEKAARLARRSERIGGRVETLRGRIESREERGLRTGRLEKRLRKAERRERKVERKRIAAEA